MPAVGVRTRWDDCDRYGHVNNAAYLALLREATERALPDAGIGRPAEIAIDYHSPLPPDVVVDVKLERESDHEGLCAVRYSLVQGERVRATARVRWRTGPGRSAVALPPLAHPLGSKPFASTQAVRIYEVGPDGEVRPAVVLQWLEQAVYRAADRVGWSVERMREADFVTVQVGHHLVLDAPATVADELIVSSRLVEMRRVSGTWHHEVRQADGRVVAADRSRGAFLDLAGRVRQAPEELIAALLRGEPE